MKEIINNKLGKVFPPAMVFAGYLFMILGIVVILVSPWISILVILLGGFVGFSTTEVRIDPATKKLKKYIIIFGLEQGKWESYENYPYLGIIRKNVRSNAYSVTNRAATTSDDIFFDICLLNKTHRDRKIIKRIRVKSKPKRKQKLWKNNYK